jgi:hypothetical protein
VKFPIELNNVNTTGVDRAALPSINPTIWLLSLRQEQFRFVGIRHPWRVDSVVFDRQKGTLRTHVGHYQVDGWPCPKCYQKCPLYDHLPERTWRTGKNLRIFAISDDGRERIVCIGIVPLVVVGRGPRCNCPVHGVRTIKPLRRVKLGGPVSVVKPDHYCFFGGEDGDSSDNDRIEWEIA